MLFKTSTQVALLATSIFLIPVSAQFPPKPEGVNRVDSKTSPGSYITYKETSICETTPGVKGYSGYVHIPPNEQAGRNYDTNTFFWFFEARENSAGAPLAVWLQGGPGVPSITAALGEHGPCLLASDSKTTINNPWSWNQKVNMLYIDQPVQVGFSYDSLVNGTIDQLVSPVLVNISDFSSGVPKTSATKYYGTFASQNKKTTVSTTVEATEVIWEFMQTWTAEFPEKQPSDGKFSVWTESYGGHYGPAIGAFFDKQNKAIQSGKLPGAVPLTLDTLGIINGCIDAKVQVPLWPQMAFNNTYGLKLINQTTFDIATAAWPKCEAAIDACRASLGNSSSPLAGNGTASKVCNQAYDLCIGTIQAAYPLNTHDKFDITKTLPNDIVPKWPAGYLNDATVQAALGVPLNFTGQSVAVAANFEASGDFVYAGGLQALEGLLDRGAKIALLYGDADYQCNWLGGEQISLALNAKVSKDFHQAGYTNISTNASHVGGVVRQVSNLSFSRVFNAGHEIPYYQPETAYKIFERVMFDRDVATGQVCTHENPGYATKGSCDVFDIKNVADKQTPAKCYMLDIAETCTQQERAMIVNGTAVVEDYVLQN